MASGQALSPAYVPGSASTHASGDRRAVLGVWRARKRILAHGGQSEWKSGDLSPIPDRTWRDTPSAGIPLSRPERASTGRFGAGRTGSISLPPPRQDRGAHRVAMADADPKPDQAPPPPTRRHRGLKDPTAISAPLTAATLPTTHEPPLLEPSARCLNDSLDEPQSSRRSLRSRLLCRADASLRRPRDRLIANVSASTSRHRLACTREDVSSRGHWIGSDRGCRRGRGSRRLASATRFP